MKVYDVEKRLGLEEKILSQSSVAFVVQAHSLLDVQEAKKDIAPFTPNFSIAGADDPDLYKTLSVLVSTSWNKNDDIFDKLEVWAARNTPRFKPTNLEHDEKRIIGGIIESWPVDEDFSLIAEDTNPEDLPSVFHIIVSSVIYKQWQDQDLKARADKLIEEIEANQKYVSMECIFRGFDYGVKASDGTNHVVARSAETAFLTRHLRAYGGTGEYDGYKIGRVLRDITFSGKGYVDRPANPDSIIFDKDHVLSFANATEHENLNFSKNGVTNNEKQPIKANSIGENEMENETLIKELKESLVAAKAENKELSEKLSQANVSSLESQIKELESSVADHQAKVEELQAQVKSLEEEKTKAEQVLSEKAEAMKKLESEMDKMKEDKKKKDRMKKMTDAGLSEDEASVKVETFANLSDEQFEDIVSTFAAMYKKDQDDKKKKEEEAMKKSKADEEDSESASASEVVDGETENGTTTASSEDETEDELSSARAALQEWTEGIVTKTNK